MPAARSAKHLSQGRRRSPAICPWAEDTRKKKRDLRAYLTTNLRGSDTGASVCEERPVTKEAVRAPSASQALVFATIGSLWNSVSRRGLWKEWAEVTVQPVWALVLRARVRSEMLKQANLKQHLKRFRTLNHRTSRPSKISVFTVLFKWQRQVQVSWQELFEVSVTR